MHGIRTWKRPFVSPNDEAQHRKVRFGEWFRTRARSGDSRVLSSRLIEPYAALPAPFFCEPRLHGPGLVLKAGQVVVVPKMIQL